MTLNLNQFRVALETDMTPPRTARTAATFCGRAWRGGSTRGPDWSSSFQQFMSGMAG